MIRDPALHPDPWLGVLRDVVERHSEARGIAAAAAALFGQPVGRVSTACGDRLLMAPSTALPGGDLPLGDTFCGAVIAQGAAHAIPNLAVDPRWSSSPYVMGEPRFRFYAGAPLYAAVRPGGRRYAIGTLAVLGFAPGVAEPAMLVHLQALADAVGALVESRLAAAREAAAAARLSETLAVQERLGRQLAQAERMAGFGSWRLTLADQQVEWSEQVAVIHELDPGQRYLLDDALAFYPEPDRTQLGAALAAAVEHGRAYDLELDFVTAKGRPRRVRAMGEMERIDGQPTAVIGVFQDITERHRTERALRDRADTDALTGLASRGYLVASLEALLARAVNGGDAGHGLAVVLIDLDNFKAANDRCGHAAGDDVLRRMAALLRADWLAGSLAGRLGGDEFVLVVTDPDLLADLDGTLAKLLGTLKVDAAPGGPLVSATLGAATLGAAGGPVAVNAMLAAADRALYAAKARQRGTAARADVGSGVMTPLHTE